MKVAPTKLDSQAQLSAAQEDAIASAASRTEGLISSKLETVDVLDVAGPHDPVQGVVSEKDLRVVLRTSPERVGEVAAKLAEAEAARKQLNLASNGREPLTITQKVVGGVVGLLGVALALVLAGPLAAIGAVVLANFALSRYEKSGLDTADMKTASKLVTEKDADLVELWRELAVKHKRMTAETSAVGLPQPTSGGALQRSVN